MASIITIEHLGNCGVRRDELIDVHVKCYSSNMIDREWLDEWLTVQENWGLVAIDSKTKTVVGYVLYEYLRRQNSYDIHDLAVRPDYRRMKIGTKLVMALIAKLRSNTVRRVLYEVWETRLGCQFFLKAMGFRAIRVLKAKAGDEGDEDRYLFQWRVPVREGAKRA